MILTDTNLEQVRDYVGSTPEDATLYSFADAATYWQEVALRVLQRRRADAAAGGSQASSFSLDGVLSVGLSKVDISSLDAAIADLLAQIGALTGAPSGATVGRIRRPDRYR
ncbi:MAG: hypothetical protein NVV70_16825 [Cellulomonas sp.]|nr:hypothetical protein [Cellulomonas sp.]MCR6649710.1 hypothetical protein [Cellulomonas sp.]